MTNKKDKKGRVLKQGEDQIKDGRYRYRYTDQYGKRHTIYSWKLITTDKIPVGKKPDKSLREKIAEINEDLYNGIDTYSAQNNVASLIQNYLNLKINLAVTTKNNYTHMFNKNIKDSFLGKMKICDVKKSDIKRFYAYLYGEKNFTIGTIQLYQNLIFPAFQMAVDDDMIRKNPCKNCMKDYVKGSVSSPRIPLTREEQSKLLEFVKNSNVYNDSYSLLSFLLGTGCRISEALGLTWENINFDDKYITIDHQVIYKKKTDTIQYFVAPTKTKKARKIPIQNDLIEILLKHKRDTYFTSISSGLEVDGLHHFVFVNREGNIKTPNTIVRTFHLIRDAFNKEEVKNAIKEGRDPFVMSDFTPHVLRHTFCTRCAENGMDVKVLQEIMGHANITVTMQVYNFATFDRTQKEVEKIDSVLTLSV